MHTKISVLFLLVLAAVATDSFAQGTYPSKPIRLLSTVTGGADGLVRAVTTRAGEALGQPFVVENQPAANGMVATEQAARAAPDGYTLLMAVPGSMVVRGYLTKVMRYQPVKDFTAITQAVSAISMIVANPAVPVNSLQDLIERSKSGAGLTYATNGIGSADHLAGELINQLTGAHLLHVPHKGAPEAVTNVVTGEVNAYIGVYVSSASMIRAGKLKPLAYTNVRPVANVLPVPLIADVVPGFQSPPYWMGFFGPANLPQPVLARLNAELVRALQVPEIRGRWADSGFQVVASSPEEFTRVLYEDLERVGRIAKGAGIKPE